MAGGDAQEVSKDTRSIVCDNEWEKKSCYVRTSGALTEFLYFADLAFMA